MGVTGAGGHVKERLSDSIDLVSFPDLHIQCMEIGNVPRPDLYSFCVLETKVGVSSGRFLNMYGEAWDMSLKRVMHTDNMLAQFSLVSYPDPLPQRKGVWVRD